MGFFDFFNKRDDEEVVEKIDDMIEFKNIIVKSVNVEKDLQNIASKYNLDIKELDFNIISYSSYYTFKKEDKYKLLKESEMEEILTEENLLNPEFSIRQQYKLNIYKKTHQNTFPIKIILSANQDFTKVFATFKKNPQITYHNQLQGQIIDQINKKKLRQGLYIGLFDEVMKENVKKITSHIMVNKAILEEMTIVVCEGLQRIEESKEIVDLVFKKKKQEENKKISLKDQTNLATVKKGEIIIEVTKPKKGKDGRNCKGKFLPKQVKEVQNEVSYENIQIGENLEEKEIDGKIVFIAKKDGYVVQSGNMFDISDDIIVDQINIKTTGSIRAGDKDIKVQVENTDDTMDAVGAGVVLDTKEVKVKGNVANNVRIKAEKVEINGQTHQTVKIRSKTAKIHLHRGFVDAGKVEINTLENGKVIADEVSINILSGGEIKAKRVFVNRLISNADIYASELINISLLEGNSNTLNIDPRAQRDFEKLISSLEKEIADKEYEIKKNTKELNIIKKRILANQDSIKEIKKRVAEIKAQNQKPPQAMLNKIKDDKANKLQFNHLVKIIKDLKKAQEEVREKIKSLNESVFDARIVLDSPWKEYNEVKFHILDPKKVVSRMMGEGEIANKLGLKVTKDNEYIIANVD